MSGCGRKLGPYDEFLKSKVSHVQNVGIDVSSVHPLLFPFQADVTRWACRKGRAAIFLDTGLGKTYCSLEWARPIWYGIKETNTLNYRVARDDKDERHICPLQLGVIERCVRLWSNPGDLVLDPFMGIGSTGYVAIEQGRKFSGIELKDSWFDWAVKNVKFSEEKAHGKNLF
jgi:hypothetical protein